MEGTRISNSEATRRVTDVKTQTKSYVYLSCRLARMLYEFGALVYDAEDAPFIKQSLILHNDHTTKYGSFITTDFQQKGQDHLVKKKAQQESLTLPSYSPSRLSAS
jgi:hypothetical protein